MPSKKLRDYLNAEKVKFVEIKHSPAYTAQEIAAAAHIPGKEVAKSVVIKVDGQMALAVLPASDRIHLESLASLTGGRNVELAAEGEFKDRFPGCEVGAMPPFGNLYEMPVYVAEHLTEDELIAFNAGSHSELFQLHYADFARLVKPKVGKFTG
jgi:Ala-tRNA(Pro) deacylase